MARRWELGVFLLDVFWILLLLMFLVIFLLLTIRNADYPFLITVISAILLFALLVYGSKHDLNNPFAHAGNFAPAWLIAGVVYLLCRFLRHIFQEGIGRVARCPKCGADATA